MRTFVVNRMSRNRGVRINRLDIWYTWATCRKRCRVTIFWFPVSRLDLITKLVTEGQFRLGSSFLKGQRYLPNKDRVPIRGPTDTFVRPKFVIVVDGVLR